MFTIFNLIHKKKSLVLCFLLLLSFLNEFQVKAQKPDILQKGTIWLKELGDLTKNYKALKSQINQSTASYNKNVTVVKGNTGSTNPNPDNIPEKKLTEPKIKNNELTNIVMDPTAFFDGQVFPSAIISMANYTGELTAKLESISRPIGFTVYSNKSNIPLRYEIECVDKKYFDKIDGTYMYTQAGKSVYLSPPIPWNYENLAKLTTSTPVNIYFRVFGEDTAKVEKLVTVQLRSINDCIYYYGDQNLQFMFSAFVQEEDKEIDNILREALNTKMVTRWVGYQSNAQEVDQQVAAIWRVLHERGFVYSSITATIGDQGNVHSQAVRTFDNALKTSQANCVDGTVVFCSILKKIGLNPVMVLVPGHCFLAYHTDDSTTNIKFLETTWLSHTYVYSNESDKKIEVLASAKTNTDKNKAYRKLFDAAQLRATEEFLDLENKDKSSINLIDISVYRRYIKPIPVY